MTVRAIVSLVCILTLAPFSAALAATDAEEALWEAARQGDLATIKELIEGGLDVNSKTQYDGTALAFAADKGHIDVARYLIEKGADVNAEDTFYESTPIGWALFNEHAEIVKLLMANGATGADRVLQAGLGQGDTELVKAALAGSDISDEVILQGLAQAKQAGNMPEIVALLEAVDIEVPEAQTEAVEVDVAVLESYSGQYKNDEIGLGLEIRVEDGTLIGQATGQPPLTLRPLSQERFEAVEFPQVKVSFAGSGGTIDKAVVEQSGQTFEFPRVTATAEAAPTEVAEPEAPAPLAPAARTAARNWPSFRGLDASGVADGQGAPTEWDVASGENVLWKTPIPGIANSSPIVWGDRVFVTTAISGANDDTFRTGNYGDVDSVEDLSEHTFKVYALDRKTGEIEWERTTAVKAPGAMRHLKATQANSTPVTDGKRVVALFGTIGLMVCYDVKGKEKWRADTGILDSGWFYDKSYQWGHASSPIIHDGLVIVQADIADDSFIGAWRLKDGKQVWRTPRNEPPSWGTPTVYRGKKSDELIANGKTIRGYDPVTGKELWSLGPNSEVTVATPIIANDLFYVTANYPPVRPIYAIKPGGRGDLSLSEDAESSEAVAWVKTPGGTYMPTPIVYGDHLYTCANNGRMAAYDARTGERVYRTRIAGGAAFTASPVAADGKLYFTNEDGDITVVRAGATYEELATNSMGEICMSTPAIADGVMIVRTMGHVYGLGEKTSRGTGP